MLVEEGKGTIIQVSMKFKPEITVLHIVLHIDITACKEMSLFDRLVKSTVHS